MKILRIIPSMNPKNGGPCQGIRNSIPALKKLGLINEVVCLDNTNSDFLKNDDFKINALGSSKSGWAYNPELPIWLKNNIHSYDVVIIHGLWLYHSYSSIKTILNSKALKQIPKVYVMPHGMLDPWFQRDKTRKLKALRNEIYWRLIEKHVVNRADGLLFTCEQELLLARETFKGYKPRREVNVGYGIQAPPAFSSQMHSSFSKKMSELNNRPYILFLSRIHPKKGIDLLIDVYLKLEAEKVHLPDLVIAGPKEGEYAELMELKAKPSENIRFTGMLQGDAKWGAFYGCEAFILPSHQENFGISVAEALACGKPVLISDQVNIWKEIKDGGAGLVENDTLEGIEKLLKTWSKLIVSDKSTMSDHARAVYEENYAVEQAAQRLKDVLLNQIENA